MKRLVKVDHSLPGRIQYGEEAMDTTWDVCLKAMDKEWKNGLADVQVPGWTKVQQRFYTTPVLTFLSAVVSDKLHLKVFNAIQV